MFLRNYDNHMAAYHASNVNTNYPGYSATMYQEYAADSTEHFEDGYLNQRYSNGSIGDVIFSSGNYSCYPAIQLTKYRICLGDGNTAVSYDDYKLSGNVVTNNLVTVSRRKTYDSENKKWKITLICAYANTSDENITISEWGIYNTTYMNNFTYDNNSSKYVLMFREVLDSPIVIEPGITASITFSVEIPIGHGA